jgi:hypothetical protein
VATFDAANRIVHVTWTDTDPRIATYTVTPNDGTKDLPALAVTVPGTAKTATFGADKLIFGTPFTFRVLATASDQATSVSAASNEVTPTSAPAAMGTITVIEPNGGLGATSATLSWAPVADNGAAVTYHVKDSTGTELGTTTGTSYTYDTLHPGDQVTLTVVPVNDLGAGTGADAALVSYLDLSAGPVADAKIDLVADVTETAVGQTYTFTYRIKNSGKAACLPAAIVRISSPGAPDQVLSETGVCLPAGATQDITVKATLTTGTYTYAAAWVDAANTVYPYSNGPITEHDLTVA